MHGVNSKIRQEEETADRDLKGIPKVQGLWQRAVLDPLAWLLYRLPGPDLHPVVEFDWKKHKWVTRSRDSLILYVRLPRANAGLGSGRQRLES